MNTAHVTTHSSVKLFVGRAMNSPRINLLASIVSLIALPLVAIEVQANSGNGVDTSLGNTLNPAGTSSTKAKDPDGLGIQPHSRTPSGFLVTRPYVVDAPTPLGTDWLFNGSLEVGGLLTNGDDHEAKFREYKYLKDGPYLNNLSLQLEKPTTAFFVDVIGGGIGHDDQFFGFNIGRYNSWKVKTFLKSTPHVFTSSYRTLWNGVGSDTLTLTSLPPGGTTSAAVTDINIGNAALQTPYSSLSIVRDKGGIRLDMRLRDHWNVFGSYTNEQRKGARPFGLVSGGGGGTGGVETAESIDYSTHDFLAGLQYSNAVQSLNVTVAASVFRNNINTLTIQNPMFVAPGAGVTGVTAFPIAVFDLYPDNDFYNLKAEYSRALPNLLSGNFTALLSTSSSRQNDKLIPYTPYAGVVVNGVAGGSWNTTDSLYKQSADAKINSTLADFGLSLRPFASLDIKGKVRFYQTKNSLDYQACNPLTGQWGRLINDGSAQVTINTPAYLATGVRCNQAAIAALGVTPSAGNLDIRSIPYDYKQRNYELDADLRVGNASSLTASIEREEYDRSYRERTDTSENKLKLGYVNRGFSFGTLRLSAETDRRRGSTYNPDPYSQFYSTSLGPLPTAAGTSGNAWIRTNDLHRKYDVAERDQNIINARFNFALAESLDLSTSVQAKDIKYPDSAYGRNDKQRLNSASIDLNWQPAENFNLFGNYSYQTGRMSQSGLQPNNAGANGCVLGTTYNYLSNGVVQTIALTPAQTAAGITITGSNTVLASNFQSLCGSATANSPLFPISRSWDVGHRDRSHMFSIGGNYDFTRARLYANYTVSHSSTAISYRYNTDALGFTATQLPLIGNGFPDLTDKRSTLESNVVIPFSDRLSFKVLFLYETGKIRDWHYDGVALNPTPGTAQATFLDSGPQDYRAAAAGVFMSIRL
jgi:hypothetical protein